MSTTQILPNVTVSSSGSGYTLGPGIPVSGSSVTWTHPNTWTTADSFTVAAPHTKIDQGGKLQLQGKNADIEINGVSLVSMLKRIEERINILTVNPELESEWEELRELGDQYRELEQRIKDKMATWNKLNASDGANR